MPTDKILQFTRGEGGILKQKKERPNEKHHRSRRSRSHHQGIAGIYRVYIANTAEGCLKMPPRIGAAFLLTNA